MTARVPEAVGNIRMERVRRYTERWAPRLAVAIALSVAAHVGPLLLARRFAQTPPLDIDMHLRTVEIGLEQAHPGAQTPATTPAPPSVPTPPRPTPPPAHSAHVDRATPSHTPPEQDSLPPVPTATTQLDQPQMQLAHRVPHLVQPDEQLHAPHADAAVPPTSNALPAIASAASDLAPMVPRGALFTLLIHTDRVRDDPNASAVRNVLSGIPDWDSMLGGTQLDPLRDLDEVLLAAANPMGADGQPPDWFVLAKGANGSDAAMRRAVEEMAAQEQSGGESSSAPSPVNPPALDGGSETALSARPDAGRVPLWHARRGGIESAEIERYGARRSFVMLGNGTAAIALPGQVDALLSAMARRGPALVGHDDPRLTMLIEADGVRNTMSFNTYRGPFPMPTRAALGVYQQRGESGPTGAVELRSEWQYDSHTEAEHAHEMLDYSRGRWHAMIGERLGQQGGLSRLLAGAAASLVGIDIGALESAIDALSFRVEGDRVVIHADLDERQVRALLNAASLGGGQ